MLRAMSASEMLKELRGRLDFIIAGMRAWGQYPLALSQISVRYARSMEPVIISEPHKSQRRRELGGNLTMTRSAAQVPGGVAANGDHRGAGAWQASASSLSLKVTWRVRGLSE